MVHVALSWREMCVVEGGSCGSRGSHGSELEREMCCCGGWLTWLTWL